MNYHRIVCGESPIDSFIYSYFQSCKILNTPPPIPQNLFLWDDAKAQNATEIFIIFQRFINWTLLKQISMSGNEMNLSHWQAIWGKLTLQEKARNISLNRGYLGNKKQNSQSQRWSGDLKCLDSFKPYAGISW